MLRNINANADMLPQILEPATSEVVAARMARNLEMSADAGGALQKENGAFWMAVRRLFENRVNDKQRN